MSTPKHWRSPSPGQTRVEGRGVLAGKAKGEPNPRDMTGLDLIVTAYGVRINYSENSVK